MHFECFYSIFVLPNILPNKYTQTHTFPTYSGHSQTCRCCLRPHQARISSAATRCRSGIGNTRHTCIHTHKHTYNMYVCISHTHKHTHTHIHTHTHQIHIVDRRIDTLSRTHTCSQRAWPQHRARVPSSTGRRCGRSLPMHRCKYFREQRKQHAYKNQENNLQIEWPLQPCPSAPLYRDIYSYVHVAA